MLIARDGRADVKRHAHCEAMPTSESPFEEEVYQALTAHGLTLHQQVGVSGYRIDLGVVDADQPGRYLLGIECDGAMYHSAQTARDRDRLRQQVLEQAGLEDCCASGRRIGSAIGRRDREGAGTFERACAIIDAGCRNRSTTEATENGRGVLGENRNARRSEGLAHLCVALHLRQVTTIHRHVEQSRAARSGGRRDQSRRHRRTGARRSGL